MFGAASLLINISRTGLPRSLCSFYQKEYTIRGLVKVLLGFFVGFCGRLEMGIGSLLERARLLVVLDHLSPELIAGLNAQGIT